MFAAKAGLLTPAAAGGGGGGNTVTFDTYILGANGGAGNWAHVTSGSDRALLAFVLTTAAVSSITYNGVSMTKLDGYTYAGAYPFDVYGLLNPTSGSHNVIVTTAGAVYAISVSYTSVSAFGATSHSTPCVVSSSGGDKAVMLASTLDSGFTSRGAGPLGDTVQEGSGSPNVSGGSGYLGVNLVAS